MRTGLWCLGLVALAGCLQVAGLEGYSFDREEQATNLDGSAETGGSAGAGETGGSGGIGGAAGTGGNTPQCVGESRKSCSECGTQSRTCSKGEWSAWSACTGECGALEECYGGDLCVAKKVSVPGGYSIDATEVTRSQYAGWLATMPSTSGQPSYCTWNTNYTPGCEWSAGAKDGHPVVCVDWCDGYAYCKGVEKRLCGKVGGGANVYEDYADATKSQWYKACTSGGQNDYPYGDTYNGQACNGDQGVGTTVAGGSLTTCDSSVSGYTGVYDLSGNAWEWEDSCDGHTGKSDNCRLRGGCFTSGASYFDCGLRCGYDVGYDRDVADFNGFGFRCCAP